MELLLYTIGHRIRYKFTLLRRYEAKIDHFQSPVIQRLSVHLEANFNLYATHSGARYIQESLAQSMPFSLPSYTPKNI